MVRKILLGLFLLVLILCVGAYFYTSSINDFQEDGQVTLDILEEPVTLKRDANGIPYLYAQSLPDLIRAQGFTVAKDRIFQIELYRALIKGEMATYLGEGLLNSDIKMRVMGLYDNASRHAKLLNQESKNYLLWYTEGYNAYINTMSDEFPVELSLLGLKPSPLVLADLVAIQHYVGFTHSQNYSDEILSLNLAATLGKEKAMELFPLNINPDRQVPTAEIWRDSLKDVEAINTELGYHFDENLIPTSLPAMGSNNWVVSEELSTSGKPILCNDPHLDARILPGPWYPLGLFTPEISAVGGAIPGLPGILTGRTKNLAFGVTNAYGDSQDLYLETPDPNNSNNYLENGTSIAFKVKNISLKVKEEEGDSGFTEIPLTIRYTSRGPIISDHQVFGLKGEEPVAFRWALAEVNNGTIGFDKLLMAKNVQEMDALIAEIDVIFLNFVFADIHGGIGHRSSGQIPIRKKQQGAMAKIPGEVDDWIGFIPKDQMPGQINPEKGWLGTANHDVVPDSFPYYYSAHFAPNYRYLRIKDLLGGGEKRSAEEFWQLLMDVHNKHAEKFAPIFAAVLKKNEDTQGLAQYLKDWDFRDSKDAVAPSIYHMLHEQLIRATLEDDLPTELLEKFLGMRYYWLQRIDELMVNDDDSYWFDNQDTEETELLENLIVQAGKKADLRLTEFFGPDKNTWKWGSLHKVIFTSPLRPSGTGRDILGGGEHPANGSGETLNRGQYVMDGGPYESQWFSSMRLVADLNDSEKIRAVVSGGNAARQFHPYFDAQLEPWLEEQWLPWWLDWQKVEEHAIHTLEMNPN